MTSKFLRQLIQGIISLVIILCFSSICNSLNSKSGINSVPHYGSKTFSPAYPVINNSGVSSNNNSSGCDLSWASQTSGTISTLNSVSAVSDFIGWAAGDGATVRRTINGSIWTNGNPNPGVINGDIYNIYAWSANDAICTTSPGATFIYKTTNGGINWTQVYTHPDGFINAIVMISAAEGYATGDPVGNIWEFLKTTNGGSNWVQVPSAPSSSDNETGWNNSFQIIGNNIWWGSTTTKVYHSTNLGINWTTGITTGTANTFAVHYNNINTGLAGGSGLVLSTDGGATYSGVTAPGISGDISGLEGTGTDWWAVRSDANIYRSTNAGQNWTTAFTSAGSLFNHINLKIIGGCPAGWAVGNNGAISGMGTMTGISSNNTGIPDSYILEQNFPNPFNPNTIIHYQLPSSHGVSMFNFVSLKVYNVLGNHVATLVNEMQNPGKHFIEFNGSNYPSGIYYYKLQAGNFSGVRKMILLK